MHTMFMIHDKVSISQNSHSGIQVTSIMGEGSTRISLHDIDFEELQSIANRMNSTTIVNTKTHSDRKYMTTSFEIGEATITLFADLPKDNAS